MLLNTLKGRYAHLTRYIDKFKPETILEVGTWNGRHAEQMLLTAQKHRPFVRYYGFDLFEAITDEEILKEKSKTRCRQKEVVDRLSKIKNCTFNLIPGNTHNTLPKFKPIYPIDFIFIDGGHSLETIHNDFFWCRKLMVPNKTVMLLDDYWPDNSMEGCKKLVDSLIAEDTSLDIEILPGTDVFYNPTGKLSIQMVRIIRLE